MSSSLNTFFRLLLPHLPASLFSPEVIQALQEWTGLLPPVYCCGFECRLDGSKQIDFHQLISSINNEPETVIHHLESSGSLPHGTWEGIKNFCSHWIHHTSFIHRNVAGIWLEFDMADEKTYSTVPNIFIRLIPPDKIQQNSKDIISIIDESLRLLGGNKLPLQMSSYISRCLNSGIDAPYISHFGVMLTRRTDTVRINIAGVRPNNTDVYLKKIGLAKPSDKFMDILEDLPRLFDRIVICLDIGADIGSRIGLECFIDSPSYQRERWAAVFDHFAEKGLCQADKCAQLLSWPGIIRPTVDNGTHWPNNLIIESMLRPNNQFTSIFRKMSHIKIDYTPDAPISVKGYFGAVHLWVKMSEKNHSE